MSIYKDYEPKIGYLYNEYEYNIPQRSDTSWTSADGTIYNIYEMETSHIQNCINLCERKGIEPPYEMERELYIRKTK